MTKRFFLLFTVIAFLLPLVSCGGISYHDTTVFAMDTVITLRLPGGYSEAENLCAEQIRTLDKMISRTDPGSETSRFGDSETGTALSEEYGALLSHALAVASLTGGAFDPTLGTLTELWNITGDDPHIPDTDALEAALACSGYEHLSDDNGVVSKDTPGLRLDLGGCAKGYACEQAVRLLEDEGVPFGIVSFGGNIGVFGEKPDGEAYRIGIRDPGDPSGVAGYLTIDEGFVSISGDYERYFEKDGKRYHHILDAKTGCPAESGVRSAAVWSRDGTEADALSTALFVLGPEKSLALYEGKALSFEAVFYMADGTTVITPGIAEAYEHASDGFSEPEFETEEA